jgi:arginase
MRVSLIYATWPVTPFGSTWYRLAEHMREAGLAQALIGAGHDVEEHRLTASGPSAGELRGGFELAAQIAAKCRAVSEAGAFPVIICGSCGVAALGAVAGLGGADTGIVWMDAHPDLNTPETSGSGMFDGMALSTALGRCWTQMAGRITGLQPASPEHVLLFGARDIDPGEAEFIAARGIPADAAALPDLGRLSASRRVYVHLDMDVHDALAVRANNFAVPGGPSAETVRDALARIAQATPLAALSVTGLDPAAPDATIATRVGVEHVLAACDRLMPQPQPVR